MTAAGEPGRWKTRVIDSFGLIATIWSIPLAIVVIGLPIAGLFIGLRMIGRMIFP